MQAIKIFSDPIWKARFPGRLDKIIARANAYKTQKEVVNNVLLGKCIQRNNFKDNPHEWDELEEFNKWFAPNMEKIWNNWKCNLEPWQEIRFKSWANYNVKGSYTGEHTHSNDVMTIVMYLNKPEATANLQVLNPLVFHWQNTPAGDSIWEDVPATTGDVIVIPGWMLHRVDINESEEERISITINATIITKEGH